MLINPSPPASGIVAALGTPAVVWGGWGGGQPGGGMALPGAGELGPIEGTLGSILL